jgi:LmbE family N-acetylglucosaminyl deacetylase
VTTTGLSAATRVLVIAAHPDDPEFGAGGTIAALARQRASIAYVIVTDGSKGTADPTVTRDRCRHRAPASLPGLFPPRTSAAGGH